MGAEDQLRRTGEVDGGRGHGAGQAGAAGRRAGRGSSRGRGGQARGPPFGLSPTPGDVISARWAGAGIATAVTAMTDPRSVDADPSDPSDPGRPGRPGRLASEASGPPSPGRVAPQRAHAARRLYAIALAEFDRERLWVKLGHASLYAFLQRELGLSNASAFYRKVAARLIQRSPGVAEPLRDGRLCIAGVAQLARVVTRRIVRRCSHNSSPCPSGRRERWRWRSGPWMSFRGGMW